MPMNISWAGAESAYALNDAQASILYSLDGRSRVAAEA